MSIFRYHSSHKIITVLILVGWAIFHFLNQDIDDNKYDNGQIKRIGSTANDKNHGTWTWYHENGAKEMEGKFVEGKRVGLWSVWDKNGTKLSEGEYDNDQLNGLSKKWDHDGNLITELQYKDDQVIQVITE